MEVRTTKVIGLDICVYISLLLFISIFLLRFAEPYIYLIDLLPNVTKPSGEFLRLKCHVDGTPPIEFQ